jgi:hypothetical protein
MRQRLRRFAAALVGICCASAQSAAPASELTLLKLRDGMTLWGSIERHDEAGFVFTRLDNGGRLNMPWNQLAPEQEIDLRERFGYLDRSGMEVMVEADRLVLDDGTEVIGKIIGRSADALIVKRSGSVQQVPKLRLREGVSTVNVPALEVFSRDELYQSELARANPVTAAEHDALAEYCERLLDFGRALTHYQKAQELQPDDQRETTISRVARKAESQEQLDHLYEIDALRTREKYDQALELVEQFDARFPESSLQSEVAMRRRRIESEREALLQERVALNWRLRLNLLLERATRDKPFEEALEYVDDQLSEDILAAVTQDLVKSVSKHLTADDVRRAWQERDLSSQRVLKASYGLGTWLLGEQRARAGLEVKESGESKPTDEKSAEREALRKKIERYLKNQQLARKSSTKIEDAEEIAAFWDTYPQQARVQWLLAYYAENSGDLSVVRVTFSECAECAGTGVREAVDLMTPTNNQDGNRDRDLRACPACHHMGVVRRVAFR